jgi:hypothetical protein
VRYAGWLAVPFVVALAGAPQRARAADAEPPRPWGYYVIAFGGGASHLSEYRGAHDDGSLSDVKLEEWSDRFQGSLGIAGRYLGVEVGGETIGRVRLTGTADGTGPRWLSGEMSARLQGYGFTGSVLLRLPASDRWVSHLRTGLLWWRTSERTTQAGPLVTGKVERSGTSLVVGAGGELRITPMDRIWLRLEATRGEVGEQDLVYYTFSGSFVLRH